MKAEKKAASAYDGKWVIRVGANGKYTFELFASNGEKMLVSREYATLASAKNGIETYKKNIEKGSFRIIRTKTGDYIFEILGAQGNLIALGADYKTRTRCESAVESTKRFAATAAIEIALD